MPIPRPTIRSEIEALLPQLRLYARALAGSQETGDTLVRALLEALLKDPESLGREHLSRQQLFRLFHAVHDPDAALPHAGRQALLLTAVVGFTTEQAAQILDQDEPQVQRSIAQACAAIGEMIRSRILIVEDEPLIAMHLQLLMEDMGHEVVAVAVSHDEAVQAASEHEIDLLLSDIQLANGSSGIDAAKVIVAQHRMPVIFITAFPDQLMTGEAPEPAFVIVKPFDKDAVGTMVSQALLALLPDFSPNT